MLSESCFSYSSSFSPLRQYFPIPPIHLRHGLSFYFTAILQTGQGKMRRSGNRGMGRLREINSGSCVDVMWGLHRCSPSFTVQRQASARPGVVPTIPSREPNSPEFRVVVCV